MLDIKLIRRNPEMVRTNLEKRGEKGKVDLFDALLSKDREYRALLSKLEGLRAEHNKINLKIAALVKERKNALKEKAEAAEIEKQLKQIEGKVKMVKEEIDKILLQLPNLVHEDVPLGKSEKENVPIRYVGKPREFGFPPKSHFDLLLNLGADYEKAAKISGSRFYFLKGDIARLDLAIIHFTLDYLTKRGFFPILPPFLMNESYYQAVVNFAYFDEMLYKLGESDLYLIATAEHPMLALFAGEIIPEEKLPIKLVGLSAAFRKEAGVHGRQEKGIFRVHQFNQTEQIILCKPEDSWKYHEELLANCEGILKALELPYRVVVNCSGDLPLTSAKTYDLEVWLPAERAYREIQSCSNCTDYQTRRLRIKYGKRGGAHAFVHALNATGLPTTRAIIAIVENYQRADGTVDVPRVLRPYLGKELITQAE